MEPFAVVIDSGAGRPEEEVAGDLVTEPAIAA